MSKATGSEITTGQILKQERIRRGYSQRDLAEKMGVTSAYISQCERDLRKPKKETLRKFAEALEMDMYSIVDFDTASSLLSDDINELESRFGIHFLDLMRWFDELNEAGQLEAVKRVQELSELQRYKRTEEGAAHGKA